MHGYARQVHKCLLENFNTPEALVTLQHLMSATNAYLNAKTGGDVKAPLVKEVAKYIFQMLQVSQRAEEHAGGPSTLSGEHSNAKDPSPQASLLSAERPAAIAPTRTSTGSAPSTGLDLIQRRELNCGPAVCG